MVSLSNGKDQHIYLIQIFPSCLKINMKILKNIDVETYQFDFQM